MIKHHVSRLRRIAGIPSGLALATLATFYLLINALTFESAEVDWHHLDSRPRPGSEEFSVVHKHWRQVGADAQPLAG